MLAGIQAQRSRRARQFFASNTDAGIARPGTDADLCLRQQRHADLLGRVQSGHLQCLLQRLVAFGLKQQLVFTTFQQHISQRRNPGQLIIDDQLGSHRGSGKIHPPRQWLQLKIQPHIALGRNTDAGVQFGITGFAGGQSIITGSRQQALIQNPAKTGNAELLRLRSNVQTDRAQREHIPQQSCCQRTSQWQQPQRQGRGEQAAAALGGRLELGRTDGLRLVARRIIAHVSFSIGCRSVTGADSSTVKASAAIISASNWRHSRY